MKYRIIHSSNEDFVSEQVTQLLLAGWTLRGKLKITSRNDSGSIYFTQVLIRSWDAEDKVS